jgi:hypothetical protein
MVVHPLGHHIPADNACFWFPHGRTSDEPIMPRPASHVIALDIHQSCSWLT